MLEVNIYDNERRFIFTNWTNEDFPSTFNGEVKIIKSGESVELPMFKAYLFTKHLVDRELIRMGKDNSLSSPEARKPYEDKTIVEITAGIESSAISKIKEQIEEKVKSEESGVKKEKKVFKKEKVVESKEFEDLK